jgi:hypothetical protein
MGTINQMTQANIDGTSTAMVQTAIVASYTSTPLPTPRPTLVPGEIGAVFLDGIRTPIFVGTPISVNNFSEVFVNHTGEYEDGEIYLREESKILFETMPSGSMPFVVFSNSRLFVYPGRYLSGATIRLADAKGLVDFSISGSCMTMDYLGDVVVVSCYEGTCSYQINYGTRALIPVGRQMELNANSLVVGAQKDIPLTQIYDWLTILPNSSHTRGCVEKWLPQPTPMPTPRKEHGPYGSGFYWNDRFNNLEQNRQLANENVLITVSSVFTVAMLAVILVLLWPKQNKWLSYAWTLLISLITIVFVIFWENK